MHIVLNTMVSLAILTTTWISCLALTVGSLKPIPQAQLCMTYANANTNYATCGKLVCPYGCSWPFVSVENCIPAAGGPRFNGNSTTQICHLGFWKESKTISACYTKTGAYKCTGEITGFAACTGCRAK
ncbi:hypothetical protein H4Q26_016024 [Puccinia striiformis f. sp. tritici PST-130]|nr:hypothetical protein H4Q26_016024 [Puccinia striiformis f. sp. tritici PST-130]